ncbi:hypothetical protein [Halomonas sp. M4R1S46]|uniref:hypothetical protein n=1 Tax=Halomonas sp. M4R1S46 TaxID=2982692 RepID=UPI0021E36968|nr:hypothetical protein [Halomonas sp. M4R1S46]UYG06838.1 hypothetical protein OCT48_14575 [Halomonas sp. M4R1S46]
MKSFLSWSGRKSHEVAMAFSDWLPCVIQAVDPWVSSEDIDRGSIWLNEIFEQLKDTNFGLVFVTKENQNKPWLLFESGALSKGLTENRVCTVLIDLQVRDIDSSSPIKHLNHTTLEKQDVLKLLKTINKHLDQGKIQEDRLEKSFDALWPSLESKISEIIDFDPEDKDPAREDKDVLNDILENVLSINRRVSRGVLRGSGRHIEKHHAEILLKRLLKMDMDRGDIEEAMEDVVPSHWIRQKLDEIFGPEDE